MPVERVRREWKWTVKGDAMLDAVVTRTEGVVEIKLPNGSFVGTDTNTVLKLADILREAAVELAALRNPVPGECALVACRECGREVYVEGYDPKATVFCKSSEHRECFEFPWTWRPQRKKRGTK